MKIVSFAILLLLPIAFSQETLSSENGSADENVRVKRAGFSLIGGAIQSLQKSAFSASASVAAGSSSSGSSGSSGSSSGHDEHSHSYNSHNNDWEEPQHDAKSFDGYQLKKSILNTLLQAVKAIAGGVTTLKGQLIKGSGYLVTQQGKLIVSGGEAVSNAGKSIISSAHLIKPEDSGHGQSLGHSLGSKFGGLTKSITSLSSGSLGSITSLSSGSAGSIGSLSSSSSSSSSSHGHSVNHGEAYASADGPSYSYNIPESNSYKSYDAKPVIIQESYGTPKIVHESYGPPKSSFSYVKEPHSSYGAPEYDGSYKSSSDQEASDVLSEILKNIPHKPMKSLGYESYSGGHSFNQLPIPNDIPPPFKPLSDYPTYNIPFESSKTHSSQYGPPSHYSDFSGHSSNQKPVAVNPKAYDIYHSMKLRLTKDNNFVTLPTVGGHGLEIQKSIQYEIKA